MTGKPELIVAAFADLFEGRGDAYGANDGGCVRMPVGHHTFARHLQGVEPIGIYPLQGVAVKWGCSDLDMPKYDMDPDDPVMARNLRAVLYTLGIRSWIERSKSKGWHVWVFSHGWCNASHMREALLYAHEVAGVPPTEVNPKNTTGSVELGNYVRLPYPGMMGMVPHPDARQVMVNSLLQPVRLDNFVTEAATHLNNPSVIALVAERYTPPPPRPTLDLSRTKAPSSSEITQKMSGLTFTVYRDGPLEGQDRSGQLARLAHLCKADGLTPGEAFSALEIADRAWCKFYLRHDCAQQLQKLVENAYH